MIRTWIRLRPRPTAGFLLGLGFIFLLGFAPWLHAQPIEPYYKNLQKRLVADGFEADWISQIYNRPEIVFEAKNVSLYFVHNESKLNYDQFASRKHIANARRYMAEHAEALKKAQKDFNVGPEVITAIILVETKLGTYLGRSTIFNNLSTMAVMSETAQRRDIWITLPEDRRIEKTAFEKKADRKSGWAYKELKALLTYAQQEKIDPGSINGSYAGAMGISQFMPSNILLFAKDGNEDGRIDLFNHSDAIVSIASYLKHYGWKPGLDQKAAGKVVYHYNHSKYYVNIVLKISNLLKN